MQTLTIASIICNLVLLGLAVTFAYALAGAHRVERFLADELAWSDICAQERWHHLRKANKGNRRLNRLVKRERREKEALVNLLAMDGTTVKFHPSREVGVLLIRDLPLHSWDVRAEDPNLVAAVSHEQA